MRHIASTRRAPLPARYLNVLGAAIWGSRHDTAVERVARALFPLSRITSADDPALSNALDHLRAVANRSSNSMMLLQIVPFMIAVTDMKGPPLYSVVHWLAGQNSLRQAIRIREVILTLEVLDRVTAQIVSRVRPNDDEIDATYIVDGTFPDSLAFDVEALFRRCDAAAHSLISKVSPQDGRELVGRLVEAAVSIGYAFVSGSLVPDPTKKLWLEVAANASAIGLHWARSQPGQRYASTCARNELAAHSFLDAHRTSSFDARLQLIESYAASSAGVELVQLLSDGVRSAALQCEIGQLRRLFNAMARHRNLLAGQEALLRQDNAIHLRSLELLLAQDRSREALQFLELRFNLISALPPGCQDDTWLNLAVGLAAHASTNDDALLLADIASLLERLPPMAAAAPEPNALAQAILAIARVHALINDAGRSSPWPWTQVHRTAPDRELLEKAQQWAYSGGHTLPLNPTWLGVTVTALPGRTWHCAWGSNDELCLVFELSR